MTDPDFDPRYGRQTPQRYYGKYAGLVTDNGPPPSGAHRGQIKVKVPGILEEASDGSNDQPLEVLAAPSFLPGFFFVPENDAPVWVEFVAGDINFPIWTGVWYPDDRTPNTADGAAPKLDQKVIRTRSGQVIQLDDTGGSEKLVIKDEKSGNTVTLDQDGISIEGSSTGSITLKLGQSILKLDPSGITLTDATGSGTAQPAVLAPILNWLLSHQHIGNMGAPTPLFPADLAMLNALKNTLVSKGS